MGSKADTAQTVVVAPRATQHITGQYTVDGGLNIPQALIQSSELSAMTACGPVAEWRLWRDGAHKADINDVIREGPLGRELTYRFSKVNSQ